MTSVGGMSSVGPALFDLSMVGNSFTVLDTLSWVKGGHQFKFGRPSFEISRTKR